MRLIAAVLASLILLSQVAACSELALGEGEHAISENIGSGDYRAYVIKMGRDDAIKVHLTEASGARVDFFLTNYSAYLVYKVAVPGMAWDFYHLGGEYSGKSVSTIDYTYYSLRTDTMVLIIDNTNRTDEGAAGQAAVEVAGAITVSANFWGFGEMVIVGIIAAAMMAVVIFAFRRKERAKARDEPGERHTARQAMQHQPLTVRHLAISPVKKPVKQPPPVAKTTRLHPVRKFLKPVKRSPIQKRKPLSPKKGLRGR